MRASSADKFKIQRAYFAAREELPEFYYGGVNCAWRRAVHFSPIGDSRSVQEEPDQHERIQKIRMDVQEIKRRALIRMADVRDLQDQMRDITARLGTSVVKITEEPMLEKKPRS